MAEAFIDLVRLEKTENKTILNLGCGLGQIFELMPRSNYLCVDIWEPYLEQIKFHTSVIKLDITNLSMFLDKSWDYVVAFDVIEHLEKVDAEKLITECERIAREKVIFYTPIGFAAQEDGKGWGKDNPQYQKHRCGFEIEEMQNKGYVVTKIFAYQEVPSQYCIKKLY